MINVREFSDAEKTEISKYILANIPSSILERMFPLTENPDEKPEVYTIMFRILNTAKNLVDKEETRTKLNKLLEENKESYTLLYKLLITSKKPGYFMKHRIKNEIIDVISNPKYIENINNLIDIFLIFAEKTELLNLDKISGLDLETPEGRDIYKELGLDTNI